MKQRPGRLWMNKTGLLMSKPKSKATKERDCRLSAYAGKSRVTVGGYMINHLKSIDEATRELSNATSSLVVEQERLAQMQAKSESIQEVLEGIEHRRIALIRQQAAEQNSAYQSLLVMNGQHTEFNRLLSLGNSLLMARQGLVNAPMRLPQAELNTSQSDALNKSRRDLKLSKLKGEAKSVHV